MAKLLNVSLPSETQVIGTVGRGVTSLMLDTPNAAELIVAIVAADEFDASPNEKELLMQTVQKIASRYSGH